MLARMSRASWPRRLGRITAHGRHMHSVQLLLAQSEGKVQKRARKACEVRAQFGCYLRKLPTEYLSHRHLTGTHQKLLLVGWIEMPRRS